MAVVTEVDPNYVATGREPRAGDLVRLKVRLMRNGFRGQVWRVVAWVLGTMFGLFAAGIALLGLAGSGALNLDVGFVVATFAGSAVVLGWALVPLLFFGVDETLDPARFALLPVRRMTLARGMLLAAFIGVPAVVTLIGSIGLVLAAAIRFGGLEAAVAAVGVVLGLTVGVVASRALTSAFAALLRSRRVRDLAALVIALLASSIGPMQLLIVSAARQGTLDEAVRVATVLGWTPVGAAYVLPFDVAAGNWAAAGARLVLTVGTIGLLLWWWSFTIESAMIGMTSGGGSKARGTGTSSVAALMAPSVRLVARAGVFGAVLACEWRMWWRDPRRRASLVSILMASAVLPIALNLASSQAPTGINTLPFTFAVTMAGTMGGMLLANQFAFDGNAYAAYLLAHVPGRQELRARAAAVGLVALPVQLLVVVAVSVFTHKVAQLPAGIGLLAASFGAAVAAAGLLSVLAPFALPENSNPFALNQGGGSAKGLLAVLAMLGTLILCVPVIIAGYFLFGTPFGPWIVAVIGIAYGVGLAALGTYIAGDVLDRRGPEVLIAVTPRR